MQLFDKSRGVGGRLATRRAEWADADGTQHQAMFDHGAPGFTARTPAFARFVEQMRQRGWLVRWSAVHAPGSHAALDEPALWVPKPDMPSLCRKLLADMPVELSCPVDALQHDAHGWRISSEGRPVGEGFDHVVLALPPLQTAPLLQAHRADWAQQARRIPMLPCWTLMGVADEPRTSAWTLALPTRGPLFWIARNETKPGRDSPPGLSHWVAHATADWSQTHLEANAADVQAALQVALADWLGQPVVWRHVLVHRWRYASVPRADATVPGRCWWDAALGLGACGDALGGAGVEGAWTSAHALANTMLADGDSAQPSATAPCSTTP